MEGIQPPSAPAVWTPMPRSCNTCRQRKIKCDKSQPCGACQRAGVQCVFPSRVRASRVKKGAGQARNSELLQRISRLENLVHKVEAQTGLTIRELELGDQVHNNAPSVEGLIEVGSDVGIDEQNRSVRPVGDRYLGGDFWTSLSDEVEGLKQLLEHPEEDEEEDLEDSKSNSMEPQQTTPPGYLFRDHDLFAESDFPQLSDMHRLVLIKKYFTNVHLVCTILHEPTVNAALLGDLIATGKPPPPDLGIFDMEPRAKIALTFSMYYAAIISMSNSDCLKFLGEDRESLLFRHRHYVESALNYADFINSMDMVPLQAFTIYLMAMRSHSKDRTNWTLVSLAVRIAHSLHIHRDGDGLAYSAFEAELRRRLWWQIIVIDMRASEDRGTETVVTNESFNTRMPLNIEDDDFGPASQHPIPERTGVTRISICLMSMDVSDTVRRLNFIPPTVDTRHFLTIEQKEEIVRQCTDRIENQYLLNCDPNVPWMVIPSLLGKLLILKLWLVLQYPLQSRRSSPQSHYPRDQSLRTAVAYLELVELIAEKAKESQTEFWNRSYHPWHALAVALAELCSHTEGDLADRAWAIIDKGYDLWSEQVADSKEGMLWRPLKKLLSKAQAARRRAQKQNQNPIAHRSQLNPEITCMPVRAGDSVNSSFQSEPFARPSTYSTGPSTAPIAPEMPDFKIDLNAYTSEGPMLGDIGSPNSLATPNLGLQWLQFPDMTTTLPGPEVTGDVNWDDWNEFINGAGEVGAQVDTIPRSDYAQWTT